MSENEKAVSLYAEFIARKEAGEEPDSEELVRGNPEHEAALRALNEGAFKHTGGIAFASLWAAWNS